MSFGCEPATLACLEWPRLLRLLAAQASTRRGQEVCESAEFQPDPQAVRERLAETTEARRLLDSGEPIPFGGIHDLRERLDALGRGRLVAGSDLWDVLDTLRGAGRIRALLEARAEVAPGLADLAGTMAELRSLEQLLARHLTEDGELRDDASPELARARRRVRDLETEVERRMAAYLRDPQVLPHLQDHYSTLRENRPVLPVRADARHAVRGILHDVSSSGTTVFIEPEGVVEPGNRLRIARTQLEGEIERILRQLGQAVGAEAEELEAQGRTLERLDFAMARARLSARLDAQEPQVLDDASVELHALCHPLLLLEGGLPAEQVIANDLVLPRGARALVISGPNAGGKTVFAKALGLAALSVRAGLHVACGPGSRLPVFDAVWADIGDDQDLRAGLSTFSARMAKLARILEGADPHTLVIVDEVGEGTEPGEGAALAQSVLEALVERGACVVATTHFNRLKELAGSDERFANASAEFDAETLLPTYRIRLGVPGSSGATWVAERMGLESAVVERARGLLDHEDRRLEALTRSLSELRQELEAERHQAAEMRAETESARAEYQARLDSLRGARAKALAAMRSELDGAFRSAREEIASVVRALQRGAEPRGRAANRARKKLGEIRERTERSEAAHRAETPARRRGVDWSGAEPGARLRIEGIRGEAVLLELPDRKGRIVARVGGARMTLPAARALALTAAPPSAGASARPEPRVDRIPEAPPAECDLRGLRVDEALDRAEAHLYRALGTDLRQVTFIHGHGTGALRSAVRAWLREVPAVSDCAPGDPARGGNGVTVVTLVH